MVLVSAKVAALICAVCLIGGAACYFAYDALNRARNQPAGGADPSNNTTAAGVDLGLPAGYAASYVYMPQVYNFARISESAGGGIYAMHNGGAVSKLNVSARSFTRIANITGNDTNLIGGRSPSGSFLFACGGEIRQYFDNGTYTVWATIQQPEYGGIPWFYDNSTDRVLINEFARVSECDRNGTKRVLASGFQSVCDIVSRGGITFAFDVRAGALWRIDASGTKTRVFNSSPDDTTLGFDQNGSLFCNGINMGFSKVDVATGAMTRQGAVGAGQNTAILTPGHFLFDDSLLGRVVFASWAGSSMTWFNINDNTSGAIIQSAWANSGATAAGPDDCFYGVRRSEGGAQSDILKCNLAGTISDVKTGIAGNVVKMEFDNYGRLLYYVCTETSNTLYMHNFTSNATTEIGGIGAMEIVSFVVHPATNNIIACLIPNGTNITIVEISESAGVIGTHAIDFRERVLCLRLDAAPNGTIYGAGDDEDTFFVGPVDRWIFQIDLENDSAAVFYNNTLTTGCGPATSFTIDSEGAFFFIANPEMKMYKIAPNGASSLFADLPLDCGGVKGISGGRIFVNAPEGVLLIQWSY